MKRIKLCAIFILSTMLSVCFAATAITETDKVNWQPYTKNVFENAKLANRPVLLYGKSDECHWCQKMTKTTFNDPKIIKLINENYYPVILDVSQDSESAATYEIMDLPTILIFDKEGKQQKKLLGYLTTDEFVKGLNSPSESEQH